MLTGMQSQDDLEKRKVPDKMQQKETHNQDLAVSKMIIKRLVRNNTTVLSQLFFLDLYT